MEYLLLKQISSAPFLICEAPRQPPAFAASCCSPPGPPKRASPALFSHCWEEQDAAPTAGSKLSTSTSLKKKKKFTHTNATTSRDSHHFRPDGGSFQREKLSGPAGQHGYYIYSPPFLFDWLSLPVLSLILNIQCIFSTIFAALTGFMGLIYAFVFDEDAPAGGTTTTTTKNRKRHPHIQERSISGLGCCGAWHDFLWLPLGALKGLKWGEKI